MDGVFIPQRGFKLLSGTANRPLAEEIAEGLGVSMAELFQSSDEAVGDNPAFRKLSEFLKSRRVTRADMDRLLAVARAMFVD